MTGRPVISAGLLPRVLPVLEEAGYQVEIEDQRKRGRRMAPDPHVLDDLEPPGA